MWFWISRDRRMKRIPLTIQLAWGGLAVAIGLFVSGCDPGQTVKPAIEEPVIEELTLHYSQSRRNLFIAARVLDEQGRETIDSVGFALFTLDSSATVVIADFLAGRLYDDGSHGDIITQDGVFSLTVSSDQLADFEGYLKAVISAIDQDGNRSEPIDETVLVQENSPPVMYLLEAPSLFERGDTLKFKIRVTDAQGYDDILGVRYSIAYPDGHVLQDASFAMRDDGRFGDHQAQDGIFTVFQPYGTSGKNQGLFVFNFLARDRSGTDSDTLKVSATNPGVTVLTPNGGESFTAGDTLQIEWASAYINQMVVAISYNADQAVPEYSPIDTVAAVLEKFDWTIPADVSSDHCKIRLHDLQKASRMDESDEEFRIES